MSGSGLAGVGVLVTRPAEQAQSLAGAIRQLGGVPTVFPGVEIEPLTATAGSSLPSRRAEIDLLVFVSPTAVRLGVPLLIEKYGSVDQLRVAAVGPSTAAALKDCGWSEIMIPSEASGSEALVDLAALRQVADWSVLVVRGEGGSDVLESILKSRGARVSFLECYRRRLPQTAFSSVEPLLRGGRIAAWMATSGEILDNLFLLAGEHGGLLRDTPLFVNHPHVAVRGFSQAVKVIFVTRGGDKGLAEGLATWFCGLQGSSN
ncbi:MAG: uroporphyrinogen-III synthase [Betaproteobacteria bacterium]|nr:MAG: uroporphyrinogen-III synthase [Betaproteobacteria bacterium]